MQAILNILCVPLNALMRLCNNICGNYVLTIVVFTLLTKIILYPVSMWLQKSSIIMVKLMPELNRLKEEYYGDKDTIAEKTQILYKREHYSPLASTLPMIIQIILLMGVIEAVKATIDPQSVLIRTPLEVGSWAWLMPLAAGLASLILGLGQNRFNPLQREQSKKEQWMTNGVSIGISLVLGFFVSVGVCVYWICSNLFSVLLQICLNITIRPEKYIDYEALNKSRQSLQNLDQLSSKMTKEEKKREQQDYKKFFSVANKHLVFYSEGSGFYKYFHSTIEYLLEHSNITIHYITSDSNDQIFKIAEKQPRIRPYFIGEKKLITLMMKMDADIVVMTMPDLDKYHIKRSYIRKDVEYIYTFHGILGGLRTMRAGCIDGYDTIFTNGDYQDKEIRGIEEWFGTPQKKLVPVGYGVLDDITAAYAQMDKTPHKIPKVLIAPSYQLDNILDSCIYPLCESLLERGYDVTIRPHPQYIRRFPQKIEEMKEQTASYPQDRFRMEMDFSSNETVYTADILVTDWSDIGHEYLLATKRPVLFIDTPMKVVNTQLAEFEEKNPPFDLQLRGKLGISIKPENVLKEAGAAADELIANRDRYQAAIDDVLQNHLYHVGEFGKYSSLYILSQLQKKAKKS